MKFSYECKDKFPPLAWLAKIPRGGMNIHVLVGTHVEIADEYFVEGAWSDDYSKVNFPECEWFCGTGAVLRPDSVIIASPTDLYAALYIVENKNEIIISNSMPCIMASAGLRLKPDILGYDVLFNQNILRGIYNYNPNIPVVKKGGKKVLPQGTLRMILFRNIVVSNEGIVDIKIKDKTKGFSNFDEYYSRLLTAMKMLARNGSDSRRKYRYGVTSLISSGYDAACCSAIAREAGATKALTFAAKGKYKDDSGVNAAKYLGFDEIIEKDAYDYMQRNDFPEIKSLSCGDLGTQISFTAFEEEYRNNLVFSGQNGDMVWNKNRGYQDINDEYRIIWRNSEIGMCESHLHQCYIPVTMTSFGILHWRDLYRISNSDEMKKWSVGGDYDRPIPRRILEERGLPRESFGRKKYGAGFFYAFDWNKRLLSRLSPNSAVSFHNYVKRHQYRSPLKAYLIFVGANWKYYWNEIVSKLKLSSLTLKMKKRDVEKAYSVSNPMAPKYLIPWAADQMTKWYEKRMKS